MNQEDFSKATAHTVSVLRDRKILTMKDLKDATYDESEDTLYAGNVTVHGNQVTVAGNPTYNIRTGKEV